MNFDNLRRVRDRLENEVEDREFNMKRWMRDAIGNDANVCGTAACLAGHCVLDAASRGMLRSVRRFETDAEVFTYDPAQMGMYVRDFGRIYLDLTPQKDWELFVSNSAQNLTRKRMIKLLDFMLDNEGQYPDWFDPR